MASPQTLLAARYFWHMNMASPVSNQRPSMSGTEVCPINGMYQLISLIISALIFGPCSHRRLQVIVEETKILAETGVRQVHFHQLIR